MSSKTEFLIIGLKQQLSKIDNFHSVPLILHATSVLSSIEHLTFSDQISSLSTSAILISVNSAVCIRPYLDSKTASTIAAFIVHSKLCGSCALVTPYYCRLVDLLCFVFIVRLLCFSVIDILYVSLQYFDTVGWVF